MKNFLKSLFFLIVEKHSYLHLEKLSIWKVIYHSIRFKLLDIGIAFSSNERRLLALKNIHKGERCFIIGNGPSLNKLDLTQLKGETTFGVNAIYLNYEKMGFYPTYYVVEDYLVAEDRKDEINEYSKSEYKFFGTYLEYVLKKDPKTLYMNVIINYDEPFEPYFSKNIARNLGVGGSVTYICLQLAYFMGFKEVYMIGFDHNYKIPSEAKLETSTVILSESDDENHFSKDYFGKGYRWHDPKVDRMNQGFLKARQEFESDGRQIFNATLGGHLEAFQRVNFDDLFKK